MKSVIKRGNLTGWFAGRRPLPKQPLEIYFNTPGQGFDRLSAKFRDAAIDFSKIRGMMDRFASGRVGEGMVVEFGRGQLIRRIGFDEQAIGGDVFKSFPLARLALVRVIARE